MSAATTQEGICVKQWAVW